MRSWRGSAASLVALAAALAAGPAWAQATESESATNPAQAEPPAVPATATPQTEPVESTVGTGSGLEEIVVTAQFRRENLQETPLAITAMSAAMMEARSQTNIAEVATRAPNVTLTPAGQGYGQTATAHIRGIGQSDYNFALEPGVGMYVDDVYYGVMSGSLFDLIDLERVEILRGPQGTLAGKNSIGGAIKLFSKKPDGDPDGYIEASYGRFDRIDVRGGADFTVVPDKVFARVSGLARQIDGFFDRLDYECATGDDGPGPSFRQGTDCKIGTEGGRELWALRGVVRWLATDTIENNLIVDVTEDKSEAPATKLIFQGGPWPGGNNYLTGPKSYTSYETYTAYPGLPQQYTLPAINYMDQWGVSNTLDWSLADNLSLKSITAYRKTKGKFVQAADGSPAFMFTHLNLVTHRQVSQELRLAGEVGDFAEWTVGGFYYDARSWLGGHVNVGGGLVPGGGAPPLIPGVSVGNLAEFLTDDPVNSDSKSGFAHVVLHPTDRLSVTGGLRYTDESKDYTFVRLTPAGLPHPTVGALNGITGEYADDRWDYRVAVDYEWTEDFLTYAQVSTGFKGGGVNPRPFFPNQVVPFGPETLTAYEIGFKSDLLERRLRLNVAGFFNEYKDLQLQLLVCRPPGTPTPCAQPANVGDAEIKGLEVETEIHPVDGMIIDGSLSYIDFEYTAVETAAGVALNMTAPYMPKWKYSIGAQYEIDLGTAGSVTPRLDYAYQSDIYTQAVNGPYNLVDSYGLLNGRITYQTADEDWQISLAVTNITDKFYYLNKYDRSAAPYFLANGQPGRPREWALTVRRRF